ncbi:MAG: hypothetical protein KBD56_09535 [Candidatus Eisenbacteria bacterium]|nr:hypothetical protein [Candidatus Eisenbacteria bacterium]
MHSVASPRAITRALAWALLFFAMALAGEPAMAQCILANPSFELNGSGGTVFGGWNQFGVCGRVTAAVHGAQAARVSGPNNGGWDVSAFWQRLDSEPGEQWEVTGHVRHSGQRPLTGESRAIVNIEWRDAAGELIDYDSFAVADPSTPADDYQDFMIVSAPAPAGTVAIHFLLGVLQAPGAPVPDVLYDQVTIYSTSSPTMDDLQWNDFPGGRTLAFAGRTWRVKGPGYYGPGPNVFCDDPSCTWVDMQGQLHLTLAYRSGTWRSTEVVLEDALGYGDYIVTTVGRLDLLDRYAVLGIFLWQYGPCWDDSYLWWNPYDEIDFEYSRWGDPSGDLGQFVVQPFDYPGNLERFNPTFAEGEVVSHAMRWLPDRVEFRVWRGGPEDEATSPLIHAWTYSGPHIPRPEQPRLHLNLWKLQDGNPSTNQEVVFQDFTFVPEGAAALQEERDSRPERPAIARLLPPQPSIIDSGTSIRFDLARGGMVDLAVFSPDGRRVRTLLNAFVPSGLHAADWDGRDDARRAVDSGVYLIRLKGAGFVETGRVTLLK